YQVPWTIEDMAAVACLSRAQFLVVFKKELGESPHEFLTRIRISEARKRLTRGESVTSVGQSVGFSSRSGFWSAFRMYTGYSPKSPRSETTNETQDSFEHLRGGFVIN